jgi:hypothetical protein
VQRDHRDDLLPTAALLIDTVSGQPAE